MTLSRKLEGRLIVHALCPGAVNSEIAREAPRWSLPLLRVVFALTFQSPERAAEPALYLTCASAEGAQTGTYLHLMQRKAPAPAAIDEVAGEALWTRLHGRLEGHGFADPSRSQRSLTQ